MTFTVEEKQQIKDAFTEAAKSVEPKNVLKKTLKRIFNKPPCLSDNDGKSYSARQLAKGIDKNNKAGKLALGYVERQISCGSSFGDALEQIY